MFRNFTSGFDSFDPDNFDPTVTKKVNNADNGNGNSAGYTTTAAKPGQKMQVNLTITNATLVEQTVELFSFLDSWVRRRKTEYIPPADPAAYAMFPMLSYEGLLRIVAGTGGVVGFNALGDLIVRGDDSAVDDPVVTVGCSEIAYNAFFEASGITPFEVAYLRQTVTTDPQINKNITWFKKTFSGGIKENTISPRAYFRPNQFQPKTIDITVSFTIGYDSGLRMQILPAETVQFAMFIQFWTGQYIS